MKIPNVILHLFNINPLFFTPLPTPAEGLFAFQSEVHRYVESSVVLAHKLGFLHTCIGRTPDIEMQRSGIEMPHFRRTF